MQQSHMVVRMLSDGDQFFWIANMPFKQLTIKKIQSTTSWLWNWWPKVTKGFGCHMPNGNRTLLVTFGCNLTLIV